MSIDVITTDAERVIPRIISVDDHVLEPPELWVDRLPAKLRERGPHVVRERGTLTPGPGGAWTVADDGTWADVWHYDGLVKPLSKLLGAVGFDKKTLGFQVATFEELRPGCYRQEDRLRDMDLNHTDVSICFPNSVPRFCGQTFAEQSDKELSLLCVRAYNDWMIDEWCGGAARGRLIPLTIVPLWDPQMAAEEIRRCAAKGSFAVTFSENPYELGLPSIHSGLWDPFFAACEETETTVCMHIGSSSRYPKTSPDAPWAVSSALLSQNAAGSLLDLIFSGTMARFPRLKFAYSETNVGWMPYVIEQMDKVWRERDNSSEEFGSTLAELPSSYLDGRVYGCIIDDVVGIRLRNEIGANQVCFEVDYPHADTRWPYSKEAAITMIDAGGLDEAETHRFLRGNAIDAFGLARFGITA